MIVEHNAGTRGRKNIGCLLGSLSLLSYLCLLCLMQLYIII